MNQTLKEKLSATDKWMRGLYMLLFLVIFCVARFIVYVLAIFQFVCSFFMAEQNKQVKDFGKSVSIYTYQMLSFLTYNTETKPFPFLPWPNELPKG
jgi:hypothetical protein